jgi:iron complex transport system substrate-binding protein
VAACVLAAACGDDGGSSASSDEAPPANPDGDPAAFPLTIDHAYGSTEIPEVPQKIVTVGLSDQDPVLALGVVPTAVTFWYGDHPHAVWPWAADELGDGEPVVLEDGEFTGEQEFNYEEILALEPDLILGLWAGITEDQYDDLTNIAPTVIQSDEYAPYGSPWQETTRTVGRALGLEDRAEELVDEVEGLFAEARDEHPEFEGVEAIVAERFEEGASFARSREDPRTRFFTELGFVLPEDIAALSESDDPTEVQDGADVSDEQMDLLDRDLLLWNIGWEPELRETIESTPLYDQLDVVRDGRQLFIDDELTSGALTWSTVLSLPYALEQLVPELTEVVDPSSS